MGHFTFRLLSAFIIFSSLASADSRLDRVVAEARPAWEEVKRVIGKQKKCELKLKSWLPADQIPDRFDETVLRHDKKFLGFYDNRVSQAEFLLANNEQLAFGVKSFESNSWFITGAKKFSSWDQLEAINASKIRAFESPLFQSLLIEPGLLIDQLLDRQDFAWEVSDDGMENETKLIGKWEFAETKEEKPVGTSFHRFTIILDRQKQFQIRDIQCTWGKKPTLDLRRKIVEWQSIETVFLPKLVSTDLIIDMNDERSVNYSEVDVSFDDSVPSESEFSIERFDLAPLNMASSSKFFLSLLLYVGVATLVYSVWRKASRI